MKGKQEMHLELAKPLRKRVFHWMAYGDGVSPKSLCGFHVRNYQTHLFEVATAIKRPCGKCKLAKEKIDNGATLSNLKAERILKRQAVKK